MRTVAMAQQATEMEKPSSRAVNPNYRMSSEILSRQSGIVWGVVLLFFGFLWFAASAGWVNLGNLGNLILPGLVMFAGLYVLVTKLVR